MRAGESLKKKGGAGRRLQILQEFAGLTARADVIKIKEMIKLETTEATSLGYRHRTWTKIGEAPSRNSQQGR
jgi:hypothetical protein